MGMWTMKVSPWLSAPRDRKLNCGQQLSDARLTNSSRIHIVLEVTPGHGWVMKTKVMIPFLRLLRARQMRLTEKGPKM